MGPIVPAFIIRLQQVPQPEQTAPGSMHNTTNSTAPTAKQQQWPDLVLEPAWHKYQLSLLVSDAHIWQENMPIYGMFSCHIPTQYHAIYEAHLRA